MPLNLHIVTGSTRPGRVGPTIATWVTEFAKANSAFEVEAIDLAAFNLPLLDEPGHPAKHPYQHAHTRRWSESVKRADAFVFVTPEYDFFPPASLINALQCLFYEWNKKPAGIVSYGGISGGLRSTQVLRGLLGNLGMVALNHSVPIPMFPNFIKDGVFEPNEPMIEGAKLMFGELHKWAETLQPARAQA